MKTVLGEESELRLGTMLGKMSFIRVTGRLVSGRFSVAGFQWSVVSGGMRRRIRATGRRIRVRGRLVSGQWPVFSGQRGYEAPHPSHGAAHPGHGTAHPG